MESIIKTIVVDDDKLQMKLIAGFVEKTNFLKLEGAFSDPVVALDNILTTSPDLLLLDVEMPEISGFDILKSLPQVPQTIIITGKKEYAVEAFELDVADYLLKPVDNYARFLKAVSKAKNNFNPPTESRASGEETFYVREDSLLVSISTRDIQYAEAFGDYVKIGTAKKVYVIHSTLTKIEGRLSDDFVRVHRSFIVQLNKIVNIDQTNLQVGDKIIPISQTMRPKLMKRIQML